MLRYIEDNQSKNQYNVMSFDNLSNDTITIFDILEHENTFERIHSIKLSIPKFGTILELDLSKNLNPLGVEFFTLPIVDKQRQAMDILEHFSRDRVPFLAKANGTILKEFKNAILKGIYIEGDLLGRYLKDNPDEEVYLNIIIKDDVYGFLDNFDFNNEIEHPIIYQLMEEYKIGGTVYDILYRIKGSGFSSFISDILAISELSDRWFWYLRMKQYGTVSKARDEFTRCIFEDMGYDNLDSEGEYDLRRFNFIGFHEKMCDDSGKPNKPYLKHMEEIHKRSKELYQLTLVINQINKRNENCDKLTDNYYFYNKEQSNE